jgi:hypothetical protein
MQTSLVRELYQLDLVTVTGLLVVEIVGSRSMTIRTARKLYSCGRIRIFCRMKMLMLMMDVEVLGELASDRGGWG